jgi:hypothetical protein
MGRKPIGKRAMTAAERQQRRRDRLQEKLPERIKRAYKRVAAGQKKKPPLTPAERMRRYRKRLREQAPPDKLVARGAAEIKRNAKRLRAIEAPLKHAAKLAAIAAKARSNPLDTSVRYPVILADPPWRFAPRSRKTGMDRAADNHYGTMTPEEIHRGLGLRLPVAIRVAQGQARDRLSQPQPARAPLRRNSRQDSGAYDGWM